MIKADHSKIITQILSHEHKQIANRLRLRNLRGLDIDDQLLFDAIGVIDTLSRRKTEENRRVVVTLSAILWTYRKPHWTGLKDFLILVLSRIGYSPSSIMVDDKYDKVTNQYSALASLIDQLMVTTHQLSHEVDINGKRYLLTRFQKDVWKKIDKNQVLGISAPTSAGKSFIIALKAMDLLLNQDGTIIYIVPTLSLVSQVSIDFRKLLKTFGLDEYEILNTYTGTYSDSRKIFVLTQEKAIGAFSYTFSPFHHIRMIVVDEIQNVEKVANESDQRAKILYDLLVEFRYAAQPDHIVISGARIENIGKLGTEVFGAESEEEESKSSPVVNITYAISKNRDRYVFKQYTDLSKAPLVLPVKFSIDKIAGIGGVQYRDNFHAYLSHVIHSLGPDSKNIIFSPNPRQARKTALALAKECKAQENTKLDSLISYISDTVHQKYTLCNTLSNGVAYHHGRMPHHVRRVLEQAIIDKNINNVVCTTTLMQGVNLPAQNVIIRNPNLFVSGNNRTENLKLTQYEIANLRGRAGRLLQDFVGRTFVLDENAFEPDSETQQSLFEETTKELHTGYEKVYTDNRAEIEYGLLNQETPTVDNMEYSFLLTYVRQTILRHNNNAANRLKSVGINLEEEQFNEIKNQLEQLLVPKDVCMRNRYWDPIDLEILYRHRDSFDLPSAPHEPSIAYRLKKIVDYLHEILPVYVDRYFRLKENSNRSVLLSICLSTQDWLKEKPLKEILSNSYYDEDADNIERTIDRLQNKISYGLPMLLKPIYDIQLPDSSFLRFIETGAFRPITRRLIEYNIPRETAIYLVDHYLANLDIEAHDFDDRLRRLLKLNLNELGYWIRIQLEALL